MENSNNFEINSKIAANGVAGYFFICFSWLLLLNKTNENINNDFVKSHVKSSSLIHLGFIITYLVFVHYGLFSKISIFSFGLNHLISICLSLILFFILLIGMYKAHNKKLLLKNELIGFVKKEDLIDINNDDSFDEKDKLTILISYIPFFGFFNYPKYKSNPLIKNNTKLNLILTLILILLYSNGYLNLSNIVLLFYTIFVVFIGINLFIQNNIIQINLSLIPTVNKFEIIVKSIFLYLKNYFKENGEFKNYTEIVNKKTFDYKNNKKIESEELSKLKNSKIAKFLIYIPFMNLIFLFSKNTNKRNHIINGVTLTFIISFILMINAFINLNTKLYLILIIPIIYGLGYLKNDLAYRMPFVFNTGEFFIKIWNKLRTKSKNINEIRKKEENLNLKVGEN